MAGTAHLLPDHQALPPRRRPRRLGRPGRRAAARGRRHPDPLHRPDRRRHRAVRVPPPPRRRAGHHRPAATSRRGGLRQHRRRSRAGGRHRHLREHEPAAPRLHGAGVPGRARRPGRASWARSSARTAPRRSTREQMPSYRAVRGEEFEDSAAGSGPTRPTRRALSVSSRRRARPRRPVRRGRPGLQGRHRLRPRARGQGRVRRLGLPRAADADDVRARPPRAARRGPVAARRTPPRGSARWSATRCACASWSPTCSRSPRTGTRESRLELVDADLAEIVTDSVEAARPTARGRRPDRWRSDLPEVLVTTARPRPDAPGRRQPRLQRHQVLRAGRRGGGHPGGRRRATRPSSSPSGLRPRHRPGGPRAPLHPLLPGQAARDRHIQGTGLGLSIVRSIVEAHGGAVMLSSEQGVGSTITVRLARPGA